MTTHAKMDRRMAQALVGILLGALWLTGAHAQNGITFDLFSGSQARVGRLGLQVDRQRQPFAAATISGDGRWGSLRAASSAPGIEPRDQALLPYLGVSAVFRYQKRDNTGFYAEAGTTPRLFPDAGNNDGRIAGNRLVFSTHAGIDFVWKSGVDIGLKAVHIGYGEVEGGVLREGVNGLGLGVRYRW